MNIKLTNTTQTTTTINGKRYDAERVIREFCEGTKNKADAQWINNSMQIVVTEDAVSIQDISGEYTNLTR